MRNRILKTLLKEGVVTQKQLDECVALEQENGDSFDKVLRDKGYVTEERLLEIYHHVTSIPYERHLGQAKVPDAFVEKVPAHFARSYNLIALDKQDGVYRVATCNPLSIYQMDELGQMLEAEVEPVLAPKAEITSLINRAYQRSVDGVEEMLEGIDNDSALTLTEISDEAEDVGDIANKAPIIRLVSSIMFEALRMRASDIHLQPFEDRLQVRFRIDGILYNTKLIPKKFQDAVTTRVKVMGRMDIAERRLPQDGRTTIKVGDGEVDVRINSVPTNYGERIVMRLLDKSQKVFNLEEIGLTSDNLDLINKFIHYSHGIILVTGPTGSGKTTTLYASLSKINSAEKNVITIEDPIEYHLGGISQIQVSNKKGLTFAEGLRSLLRQDPNVMMVGEIRDAETARIAIQAALTGHLVFSTLHTNDSASSITRLLDLGVEAYLVASSVIVVIAQRLVRVICDECKNDYDPTDDELKQVGIKREEMKSGILSVGMGCARCLDTGYSGRTAIYEIMPVTETIRDQVMTRASATVIKQGAVERGLRTLRMDGAEKVKQGLTTIEEVLRVTQLDLF